MEVDRRGLACFVNSTQGGDLLRTPVHLSSAEEAEAEGGAADMDPESQDERLETVTTGLCPEQGWTGVHRSHEKVQDQMEEERVGGGRSCLSGSRGTCLPEHRKQGQTPEMLYTA